MKFRQYINEEKERKVYSMYGREIRDAEKLIEYIWDKLDKMSENDIANGRVLTQEELDQSDLKWLNEE